MRHLCLLTFAALSLGLIACENVDSEDVMTDGIYADITAVADGEGATLVKTTLRVGGARSNTFLELSGDDVLKATQGTDAKQMGEHQLLGSVWYEASFDVDAAETAFVVGFERTVDEGAPSSTATLPAPFAITGPAAGTTFSRASADITLTWDPASTSDDMALSLDGNCVRIFTKSIDGDPGTFVISHSDIVAQQDQEDATCEVTVVLERRRAGSLDPAYGEGGAIHGIQRRELKFRSEP